MNIRDLVPEGRIANVVYEGTTDNKIWYAVWKEADLEPPNLAVHAYASTGLVRSGEYRLTQMEALQLVVDLMGGVSV